MKENNNYGNCKCGGKLEPDEDRFICSACGKPTFSKALRHKYLERNKTDILKDLDALTRAQVIKKWGIPTSTLSQLMRRWKYHPAAPPHRASARTDGDGRLPVIPRVFQRVAAGGSAGVD